MIDQMMAVGLSNTCFALLLAIVAMLVGARSARPHLAHLLWLLVLVKLVTPPLVSIPVDLFPLSQESVSMRLSLEDAVFDATDAQARGESLLSYVSSVWNQATPWLGAVWLFGSGVVLAWSLVRVFQFNRLLRTHTETAPQEFLATAADLATCFKLRSAPEVCTTTANISPMVWWTGGRIQVIIPVALIEQLERRQWRWVLAHELAHVRRRDHLVRWLEWLARVGFWWNPVVWWAQRNLRATEEICCDALVISTLEPEPRSYANSILAAVESLARPILRPPAMASEIISGGFLERRFKMMVSSNVERSNSRWLQACVLLCASVVLPLGVVYAQDEEAVGKRLRTAVEAGELSGEQAKAMMRTLRKADVAQEDRNSDQAKAYLAKVKKELGVAVEAGEISEKVAAKKYEAAEKAVDKRMAAGRGRRGSKRITKEDYERVEASLKKAVAEGKLTEKEAHAKLAATREMMKAQGKRRGRGSARPDWEGIKKRVEGAVQRGDLTREEADAKYKEIKEKMSREGKPDKVDWEAVKRKIEGAVERGDLTREEADAKYQELKK